MLRTAPLTRRANSHKDELNVTVKVINSTDDNQPGKVTFSNRQPEAKSLALEATLTDLDLPTSMVSWQWYRGSAAPIVSSDDTNPRVLRLHLQPTRAAGLLLSTHFQLTPPWAGWEKINGATSAKYTPKPRLNADETENPDSDLGRCLRAAVTYRDAVDPTHSAPDVNDTTVDETLEGTYAGTEWPVKRIDEKNKHPEFKDTKPTGFYTAEIEENTSALPH